MPTDHIPTERLDNLACEAARAVFESMVGEIVEEAERACLLEDPNSDLLDRLPLSGGVYAVIVSWVGDTNGKVMLVLPTSVAERFILRLFDLPSLDWLEGDTDEAVLDALGELGNMMAGLVKGGLTKWFPKLMLTTPKVLKNRRMKVDNAALSFRSQYIFNGLGSKVLVDFCCE